MQDHPRVGYCCKTIDQNGPIPKLNTRSTTMTWLREHPKQAENKLVELMLHNLQAVRALVEHVAALPKKRRMVRIGSDILPGYTEPSWRAWWQRNDVQDTMTQKFSEIGDLARAQDVRLSFHPGQFVVLASDRPDVVERSIEEFEYHARMAEMMGYGRSWQDFKCNVHISGRAGYLGILDVLPRLSQTARNIITIENEEITHGLDQTLMLADHVALVLDLHHHWVKTGEYISAQDDRVKRVRDSWRGQRPVLHYSVSREDVLLGHDPKVPPCRDSLMAAGIPRSRLRAHSDGYWNHAVNDWAVSFSGEFDIQCESKMKNLASAVIADMIP